MMKVKTNEGSILGENHFRGDTKSTWLDTS